MFFRVIRDAGKRRDSSSGELYSAQVGLRSGSLPLQMFPPLAVTLSMWSSVQ